MNERRKPFRQFFASLLRGGVGTAVAETGFHLADAYAKHVAPNPEYDSPDRFRAVTFLSNTQDSNWVLYLAGGLSIVLGALNRGRDGRPANGLVELAWWSFTETARGLWPHALLIAYTSMNNNLADYPEINPYSLSAAFIFAVGAYETLRAGYEVIWLGPKSQND